MVCALKCDAQTLVKFYIFFFTFNFDLSFRSLLIFLKGGKKTHGGGGEFATFPVDGLTD